MESWLWVCRSKERRLTAGRMSRVESAGIVLMLSDPLDILRAISLARAAYRKMVQHLVWATVYNVIANARSISMSELHAGEELPAFECTMTVERFIASAPALNGQLESPANKQARSCSSRHRT